MFMCRLRCGGVSSISAGAFLLLAVLVGVRPASAEERAARSDLVVTCDFPSGSGEVVAINQKGRSIRLMPSKHPDLGWRCWWYIKVTGIVPGETIALEVGGVPWATPRCAAWSCDSREWRNTGPGAANGRTVVYRQKVEGKEAYFAWGPPFTHLDSESLVAAAARASAHATSFTLCRSLGGRDVPALRVIESGVSDAERVGIWVQARQHAWESGSSWVCRGFVEWLVSDDERAEQLRRRSLITVVPVMDVDNVALGAGGKGQKPHDHNRDWTDDPYFPAVRAAMESMKRQDAEGRFDLFVDLHNPAPSDREPFFFVSPSEMLAPLARRNLIGFLRTSQLEIDGPLKYRGIIKESDAAYDLEWKRISKNWVTRELRSQVTSVTLETPWNSPDSSAENYRTVGRQLGLAIERHFRSPSRKE